MPELKKLSVISSLIGFTGCGWLIWIALADHEMTAVFVLSCYLITLIIAVVGLWKEQGWAVWTARTLAAMAIVLGIYLAHFAWTFWLFQEPTLKDRVLAVLKPRISFYLIGPVLWFFFTLIFKKKGKHHAEHEGICH